MKNNNASSSGIGFIGVLAITFIVLKLLKVITWSWWWVLSPIWITWLLVLIFALIYILVVKWVEDAK